jgi:hypothetical protein
LKRIGAASLRELDRTIISNSSIVRITLSCSSVIDLSV